MAQFAHARPSRRLRAAVALLIAVGAACLAALLPAGPAAATSPPRPWVESVAPNHGPAGGGTEITITGQFFDGVREVQFVIDGPAGQEGPKVPVKQLTATTVTVTTPKGLAGVTADVVPIGYFGPGGGYGTLDDFTWDGPTRLPISAAPTHGDPAGGTRVTLTGAGVDFQGATSVKFGETAAPIVERTATSLVVTAPAGQPLSKAAITVIGKDGHIDGRPQDKYAYDASTDLPVVTSVSPSKLWDNESRYLEIRGSALESATKVEIGGEPTYFTRVGTGPNLSVYIYAKSVPAGKVDVRVTTPVGVSANTPADDLEIQAAPPEPKITSISPASGSEYGGDVVTVRGEHLSAASVYLSQGGIRRLKLISDTEIRFTTGPRSEYAYQWSSDISITTPGGTTSSSEDGAGDFSYDTHVLDKLEMTPEHGPFDGGNEVTLTSPRIDFRDVVEVSLGGRGYMAGQIVRQSETSLTFIAPKAKWASGVGSAVAVDLWDADDDHINSFVFDAYGYEPATSVAVPFTTAGKVELKTLARGTLALAGTADLTLAPGTGVVEGDLTFKPTTGRLIASGFLPVTAKIAFVPSGKTTGTLDGLALQTSTKVRVKVLDAKLFGAIPLVAGNNCQSRQLTELKLASAEFALETGGQLKGTFAISDLNGCGVLNGLVSPLTAGGGNTLALDLTPKR